MRILVMTDSPFIPSGQARVGREIATGLARHGHEVGYIGWWHPQSIFPNLPFNIQFWWTNNSRYGSDILDFVVMKFRPDVVLTIGDFWHLAYMTDPNVCQTRKLFQWCSYIPVDGEPECGGLPPAISGVIGEVDIPIAYTDYAKQAVLKSCEDEETKLRIETIYHGVDINTFKPMEPSERRKLREKYGIHDKFIFLTVSRNQTRKNIPDLFRAWKIFSELPETKGRVILWPHMFFKDTAGWDIDDILSIMKLRNNSIFYYNQIAHTPVEHQLLPESDLAELYGIADAFILLSSEGFGLPTLEAMATRLPCVLLNYAASAELGANGCAHLIDSAGSITWVGRYLTEKPLPDKDKTVEGMLRIFKDKRYRDEIASKGYEFAKQYTWDRVSEDWNMLFMRHEIPFVKPFNLEVVT